MNNDERLCSIALTLCPGIGHIGAKRLIDAIGSAVDVFGYREELPERLPGVNSSIITALDCPAAFLRAEREMEFVEKNRLTCLTLRDEAYPSRLRECEDAPIVLFFKGNTDFNRLHVINAVGEAAHYQGIREKHGQIVHEIRTKPFAVLRCTARTYHIDNM